VTEGTITRWLKQVGEAVERDEPLFEVSTDKVDSEVPSPAGGVVSEIRVPEGDTVDVGTVLAVVLDASAQSGGPVPSTPAGEPTAPAPPAATPPAATPPATPAATPPVAAPAATPPVAAPAPGARPVEVTEPPAPPPAAAPSPAAVATPVAAQAPPSSPAQTSALSGNGWDRVMSPVVRRLINEHQMDPATLAGSGPGGRITRADVLNVIDAQASSPSATVR
jgi:pyruvate dehydrogenase E2 component (dihydrolipoamide acetyltransferase)